MLDVIVKISQELIQMKVLIYFCLDSYNGLSLTTFQVFKTHVRFKYFKKCESDFWSV